MQPSPIPMSRRRLTARVSAALLAVVLGTVSAQEPPAAETAAPAEAAKPIAPPAPPSNVTAEDADNDKGEAVNVKWDLSPDDKPDTLNVVQYEILRAEGPNGPFVPLERVDRQKSSHSDKHALPGVDYYYQVVALGENEARSEPGTSTAPANAVLQWFDKERRGFFGCLLVNCGAVIFFIYWARTGRTFYVRKIAGLEAVEEAVGRATEMGRANLFIPGIQDMNDIQTVAGITILGRVAKIVAENGADIEVPTSRSLVMTAARETVQSAFLSAGRPDAYNEDKIYYVTDEQFGYVAAVSGLMVREKPAACFYMGSFFAESLILAETGNSIGAIQLAGTAQPSQLPFFVAACDYTLIGEEFFAASAYLSGDPEQIGSLKGQDVGKLIVAVLIVFGTSVSTLQTFMPGNTLLSQVLDFMQTHMLR